MKDRCICCGDVIPEGRQVCINCEEEQTKKRRCNMGKLSKRDIEEIKEFLSRGCEYSGTEETISEIVYETLESMDKSGFHSYTRSADEIALVEDDAFATLDEFVNIFWDKTVEKILCVIETQ